MQSSLPPFLSLDNMLQQLAKCGSLPIILAWNERLTSIANGYGSRLDVARGCCFSDGVDVMASDGTKRPWMSDSNAGYSGKLFKCETRKGGCVDEETEKRRSETTLQKRDTISGDQNHGVTAEDEMERTSGTF
jgi:hypothetical protein